jgi:zinc protease
MSPDRTKAPMNDDILDFNFPAFEKINLNKKISLYLSYNPAQPLASIKIVLKNGALTEPINGTAFLASQMLIKGTNKLSSAEIANQIENFGATINSSAQWDDTSMSSLFMAEFLEPVLEIVMDCLLNSTFDEAEFEKIRTRHISSIMQENSDINYLVQYAFNKAIFDGSGYGQPLIGTIESIKTLTRDDLFNWYRKLLSDSEITIIIAGNFDQNRVVSLLNSYVSALTGTVTKEIFNINTVLTKNFVAIIDKPESSQSALKVGNFSIDRTSPDFPFFQILNTIFGGYFLSRLNMILREEKGLTYGVYSMIESRKYATVQTSSSGLNKEYLAESVKIILDEYKKIQQGKFAQIDLQSSVRYILGSFLRSIETPQQIAGMIQSIDHFELEHDFFDIFYRRIAGVTLPELKDSALRLFNSENFVIAAVGEKELIKEQLKGFGDLIIFEV